MVPGVVRLVFGEGNRRMRVVVRLCDDLGLTVQRALSLSRSGSSRELKSAGAAANIRGEEAIFVLTRE